LELYVTCDANICRLRAKLDERSNDRDQFEYLD
jgi:hypothetical protein